MEAISFASILLRNFASIFISLLACNFLFFVVYSVLASWWWWSHRMNFGMFLPLYFFFFLNSFRRMASLMTQWQRIHLPMQLIWVQSQGQKDPLKKEMTTHQLFSKYLRDFACEIIWSWTFVCWEFINHSFKFSTCDWSVHIFYFFLAQSWEIVIF